MAALGADALKLVREAKRAEQVPTIPAYNEDVVRTVQRESTQLYEETLRLTAMGVSSEDVRIVAFHAGMQRNKRCLLAYHKQRMQRVQALCWELGALPPANVRESLSKAEVDYMRSYNGLLTRYKASYMDLDLTATLLPPKELFVEVRVVTDCGKIQTEEGTIHLKRNSQHFVRRTDVEHLVKQGYLLHID